MEIYSVYFYSSSPFICLFVIIYALKSRRIVALSASICAILRMSGLAQIYETIVAADAISVVNLNFRPFTRDDQPRETMCFIIDFEYSDYDMAAWMQRSS